MIDLATFKYTEDAGLRVNDWATREDTEDDGLDRATLEYCTPTKPGSE